MDNRVTVRLFHDKKADEWDGQLRRSEKDTSMTTKPVQVTFRNMDTSAALEEEVRSRAAWLESFYPRIIGCRVVVESPHRHRQRGWPVHVRIELSLPGEDVIVNHHPARITTDETDFSKSIEASGHHQDPYLAVHEAFDIARRCLEDSARRQRPT